MTVMARWRSSDGGGLEHLRLEPASFGHAVTSVVIGSVDGAAFALRWRLALDPAWRTRRLDVEVVGSDRRLALLGDGEGHWTNADHRPLPALAGAIDVDLLATPFTNTLPIRRLQLPVGGTAEVVVAYVTVPSLELSPETQRYTRRADRLWLFEALGGDFRREIEVDGNGLVVRYPGLFERVA